MTPDRSPVSPVGGKQKGPPWRPLPFDGGCPYDRTATSRSPGERTGSDSRAEKGSSPQPNHSIACAPIPTSSVGFCFFSKSPLGHLSMGPRSRLRRLGYKGLAWETAGGQTTSFLPHHHCTRTHLVPDLQARCGIDRNRPKNVEQSRAQAARHSDPSSAPASSRQHWAIRQAA